MLMGMCRDSETRALDSCGQLQRQQEPPPQQFPAGKGNLKAILILNLDLRETHGGLWGGSWDRTRGRHLQAPVISEIGGVCRLALFLFTSLFQKGVKKGWFAVNGITALRGGLHALGLGPLMTNSHYKFDSVNLQSFCPFRRQTENTCILG